MGVCTYNFSNSFANSLLAGTTSSGEYTAFASFVFSGPSVEARACPVECQPGAFVYSATWADVPITMTGQVDLVSNVDPRVILRFVIAGSGMARAQTFLYPNQPATFSYRQLRYDFRYDIVPEPRAIMLVLVGMMVLGAWRLRVRVRAAQ